MENSKRLVAGRRGICEGGRRRGNSPASQSDRRGGNSVHADISACCRSTCWKKAATTSKAKRDAEHQRLLERREGAGRRGRVCNCPGTRNAAGRRKKFPKRLPFPPLASAAGRIFDGQILVTHGFDWNISLVHAALREAAGELRGGNQNSGGGVENFSPNLKRLFSGAGVGKRKQMELDSMIESAAANGASDLWNPPCRRPLRVRGTLRLAGEPIAPTFVRKSRMDSSARSNGRCSWSGARSTCRGRFAACAAASIFFTPRAASGWPSGLERVSGHGRETQSASRPQETGQTPARPDSGQRPDRLRQILDDGGADSGNQFDRDAAHHHGGKPD